MAVLRKFVKAPLALIAALLVACERQEAGQPAVVDDGGYEATPDDSADNLSLDRVGIAEEMAVSRGVGDLPPMLVPLRGPTNAQGVRLWWLMEDYEYVYEATCELVTVPKNFVTDLASIPAIARARHNPADFAEAALVHDWLYAVGPENTRPKIDQVFLALMLETNIEEGKAREVYRAVRIGGNDGYGKKEDFAFYDPEARRVRPGAEKPKDAFKKTICD